MISFNGFKHRSKHRSSHELFASAQLSLSCLLGLCLTIQVVTGIFLAIHYIADVNLAFNRVNHIRRDVNYG